MTFNVPLYISGLIAGLIQNQIRPGTVSLSIQKVRLSHSVKKMCLKSNHQTLKVKDIVR